RLKLIIIDEISFCGTRTVHDINYYLQMLFNRDDLPFGGKSVLAVGDFQLKPVFDKSIYETVSEPGAAVAPPL
ncbi:hypothetical protein BgiMline_028131, partial [Biomphalaria glabrata]